MHYRTSKSPAFSISTNIKTALEMGVNSDAMHRVSAISSAVFTGLPHSGAILSTFALTGLTHEKAFKYSFITMIVPNLLALIAALLIGIFLY